MKTKIKRHSRAVISVILAISMLVSCMMVGLIATDAARVTDSAVGAKTDDTEETVGAKDEGETVGLDSGDGMYLGIGSANNMQWYGMGSNEKELVLDSAKTIYFHFYVGGSKFAMDSTSTQPSEACTEDWVLYAQKGASNNISASLPAGTYKFKLKGVQSNNTNCLEYQFWKVSGGSGGGDDPTPGGDVTEVTDTDLIAILQGTKAQFYFAHELANDGRFLYDSNSNKLASGDFILFTKCKAGFATVPAINYVPTGDYYISDWEGWQGKKISGTIKSGYLYCMYNKDSPSFHSTGHLDNSTDATVSWSKSSETVKYGATSSTISATKSGSTAYAALGNVKYYYQDGTKFYEFSPSNLPNLEPGTYNVYAAASDGKIYIAATSTGTLTVSPPLASELTLTASKTTLTEVEESTTLTATATDLQNVAVTYKLYKEGTATPIDTQSKAAGTNSATFTVTPNARSTTYYVTVSPTTGTAYDAVTSNSVTIANTADDYIPKYTVTFGSNNASYGTVTAKDGNGNEIESGASVKEGESVTFTATPKTGNVFTKWNEFDTKSTAITRVVRANTTATGNFGPKGYKIATENAQTPVAMRELSNGTYISTSAYGQRVTFQLFFNANGTRTVSSEATQGVDPNGTKYKVTNWETGTTWKTGKLFTTYDNQSGTRYVVYDPATDQVWLTSDPDDLYSVKVIAKDGTIRYGYSTHDKYTHSYGNTTLTAKDTEGGTYTGTNDYDYEWSGNTATKWAAEKIEFTANDVRKGITLHIRTDVNATQKAAGYYVKGFAVTGYEKSFSVLWPEVEEDNAKIEAGYNEFDLTLDAYPEKNIEITPIYWIKETSEGDNVRFYVESFAGDVYKEWGGNLAINAYSASGPILGEYPGQPMINYNGRYVVDLPRTGLQGITLNNYVWDRVHSNLFYDTTGIDNPTKENGILQKIQAANKQTYDFNDFIKIKESLEHDDDPTNNDEDIIFSFRYKYDENHNTLDTSNHGKLTYYKDSDAPGKNPVVTVDTNYDYENQANTLDPTLYQWENLIDLYKNRVDILGNKIDTKHVDGSPANPKAAYTNPVRIVSNGYDFSEAGKYATAWAVYVPVDSSNNLVPTGAYDHYQLIEVFGGQGKVANGTCPWGSSSYLVDYTHYVALHDKYDWEYKNDSSKTHSGSAFVYDLAMMPTVISYEYSVNSNKSNLNLENAGTAATDGNPGLRTDGRWFASSSKQFLKAHTIIEIAEKDQDDLYHRDYYQGNGIDYTYDSGYDATKNTGIATGIKAYFDNDDSDDGVTSETGVAYQNTAGNTEAYAVSDGDHVFKLRTTGDTNGAYVFKAWYMYTNGLYTWVSDDPNYESEATANDVYVARYYKVPSGTLNISHSLTTDSRGSATCSAKAEILASNGTTVEDSTSYPYTEGTLKIGSKYIKSTSDKYIRITIKTELGANTLFDKFKEKITTTDLGELIAGSGKLGITATVAIDTSSTDKTATITFPINKLFTTSDGETTQTVKSLPFYSKTSLPAYQYEITYNFGTRKLIQNGKLSDNRLWGNQFYKYKGTFTNEEVDQYLDLSGTPTFKSAETANYLAEHSPYEKNFLEDTVWDFNSQTISYNDSTLTFSCSLTAAQTTNTDINVTFKLPFDYTLNTTTPNNYTFSVTKASETDKPVYKGYKTVTQHESVTMDFLDWFSLNGVKNKTQMSSENQPEFLKVPDVLYNDATNPTKKRTFKYWAFFKEGDNIDTAAPYQKCYSSALNQAVYQDTVFYPVYTAELEMSAEEIKEVASNKSATITFLGVTRDQWNYNGGNTANSIWGSKFADRIFTDFVLSFEYENILIPTNDPSFKTGLIIQTLDTPAGGIENATPESLATAYASSNGKDAAITKIKNTASDISESGVGNYLISYNQQALDDRNAIEYYYGIANVSQSTNPTNDTYTNPTTRRNFGYRAYSFIKKGTGSSAEVIISDPVYFTIYDVASIQNGSKQVASGS